MKNAHFGELVLKHLRGIADEIWRLNGQEEAELKEPVWGITAIFGGLE